MIISMFKIICVTNRKLCRDDFFERIEKLCKSGISSIILREKDLSGYEYFEIAKKTKEICDKNNILLIINSFYKIAEILENKAVHLPLYIFENMTDKEKKHFEIKGVSCHSTKEAVKAEELGADYIVAGHIFETNCKKGLAGRGISFLENVCKAVSIPVYAIGGIDEKNISQIKKTEVSGICLMSSLMTCKDIDKLVNQLRK